MKNNSNLLNDRNSYILENKQILIYQEAKIRNNWYTIGWKKVDVEFLEKCIYKKFKNNEYLYTKNNLYRYIISNNKINEFLYKIK